MLSFPDYRDCKLNEVSKGLLWRRIYIGISFIRDSRDVPLDIKEPTPKAGRQKINPVNGGNKLNWVKKLMLSITQFKSKSNKYYLSSLYFFPAEQIGYILPNHIKAGNQYQSEWGSKY